MSEPDTADLARDTDEEAVERVMSVLNYWFDGVRRIDRNSEMVKQLAALTRTPALAQAVLEKDAEIERLRETGKAIVSILDAVRMSVGLGKTQLARIEVFRAAVEAKSHDHA